MIIKENGRWKSIRTNAETEKGIADLYKELSDEEKVVVDEIIKEYGTQGVSPLINTAYETEWDPSTGPPVPVRQWIDDEQLIGETGKTLYPILKNDLCELFEGGYSECILTGAIGWGKDYFATTCVLRVLYELLCLKNPQQSLGLGAGEPIHIVPISHRKEAARRVVFGGVAKKMNLSPFFRGRFEETMDEIRFKDKNIYIIGGSSQDAGALGLNVFCSVMDELNFMGRGKVTTGSASGEQYDKAQMIYNALARRVKSRYQHAGVKGLVFLVSSKRATEDFTERKLREAQATNDASVFVRDYATWDVKPNHYKKKKWYSVAVSPKEGRSRILGDDEPRPEGCQVFQFPEDFLEDFKRDPDGSTRDIAGIATDAVNPFITEKLAVDEMMHRDGRTDKKHIFDMLEWDTEKKIKILWDDPSFMTVNARKEPIPTCCPYSNRHLHLDLSKNGCATGFVIGHRSENKEVMRNLPDGTKQIEEAPVIHIDTVLRINAPTGGEIDHESIRELVYKLTEGGLPIRSISMDQWCSVPNMQLFKQKGYKVTEQSVVKTLNPYLAARNAIFERRVICPVYENLRKELYELEMDKEGRRVDHPRHGSKDLADAWAGVIFFLTEFGKVGRPFGPTKGTVEVSEYTSRVSQSGGPQYLGNGDWRWPDEQQAVLEKEAEEGGLSSWIIT